MPPPLRPRRVQIFDDRAEQAFDRPAQPGAEQRVNDQVRLGERRARGFPFRLARHDVQFAETLLPALQIGRGIALDRTRIRKKKNDRRGAKILQQSGDHQAVAAVISLPAQDQDFAAGNVRKFFAQKFGDGRARVLHQFHAGNAVALGGEPVRLAHLCRGQDFHARFSCGAARKSASR